MTRRITLVHTVPTLAAEFGARISERLPDVEIDDVVMDDLLRRTIADGGLSERTASDLAAAIARVPDGTELVLVTCSSLGPVVDALSDGDRPVLRVDEPMARRAVALGSRIGVLATLSTTMDPTSELLRRVAKERGRDLELVTQLCEGAFDAVRAGDTDRHDELVRDGLAALLARGVDVVVLAQASMSRVVSSLSPQPDVPVLSSPPLAVDDLAERLQA